MLHEQQEHVIEVKRAKAKKDMLRIIQSEQANTGRERDIKRKCRMNCERQANGEYGKMLQ